MDFSDVIQSNGIGKFSNDGRYLCHVFKKTVFVLEVEQLTCVFLRKTKCLAQEIQWGSDSAHFLIRGKKSVESFLVDDDSYKCTIDGGVSGISNAVFSPDCQYVLTVSENLLRVMVWSLDQGKAVGVFVRPKFRSIFFEPSNKYLLFPQRVNCEDVVGLYTLDTWERVFEFKPGMKDMALVRWSPNGNHVAVAEDILEYHVSVFSLDGRKEHTLKTEDGGLGIKTMAWGPNNQLLAIGSYDNKVRVLCSRNWDLLCELSHDSKISEKRCHVFREVVHSLGIKKTRYVMNEVPVKLKSLKKKKKKTKKRGNPLLPKTCVTNVKWSSCGRYFFTQTDKYPHVVWVWKTAYLGLAAVIIQKDSVKSVKWDNSKEKPRLALCTGNGRVYMWTEMGCFCVESPNISFLVGSLQWSSDSKTLMLIDTKGKKIVCCYPDSDTQT